MKYFLAVAIMSWAHSSVAQLKKVYLGDTLVTFGHKIVFEEGLTDRRGYVSIAFQMQKDLLDELNQKAEEEMWDLRKRNEEKTFINSNQKGGQLVVYIARATIEAANTKWFTVIVKKGDKELLRKPLGSRIASVPGYSDYWTNLAIVSLPMQVTPPFDVYVIESGGHPPKSKFVILN